MTPNQPTPPADNGFNDLPRYTASGHPETRGYRLAWQVWLACMFVMVVLTLTFFLMDKFRGN